MKSPQFYDKKASSSEIEAGRVQPIFIDVRLRVADVLRAFPASEDRRERAPDLEAVLREALSENPKLTQTEAEKIARERGAIEPRKKFARCGKLSEA